MTKKIFMAQDPALKAIAERIAQLEQVCTDLIEHPDEDRERQFIADVDAMKRDLNAELIARNPPPGWDALEQKVSGLIQ